MAFSRWLLRRRRPSPAPALTSSASNPCLETDCLPHAKERHKTRATSLYFHFCSCKWVEGRGAAAKGRRRRRRGVSPMTCFGGGPFPSHGPILAHGCSILPLRCSSSDRELRFPSPLPRLTPSPPDTHGPVTTCFLPYLRLPPPTHPTSPIGGPLPNGEVWRVHLLS